MSILAAAGLGLPAYLLRLPLMLAYLAAGVLLGPHLGLGLIHGAEEIATISEIGLVLLLFILGLEIDIRKLMQAGKAVLVNGVAQFLLCALLSLGFFSLLDLHQTMGAYAHIYLAVACSLSSTLVVIKILSDRMQLDTLNSRITVGILILQDMWAIGFLAVQPDLGDLRASAIALSVGKVVILVSASWLLAKYALTYIFRQASTHPELMLVTAMAWCFAICGLANMLSLSLEMGALVAGVTIASFPYHADIAAKVSSLRDFFITLFFVSLGLQIPMPTPAIISLAAAITVFVLFSRLLTVFPVLYFLGYGSRSSMVPAINLSQLSEFSLVLTSLGVMYGHVSPDLIAAFILALVVSALISTAAIPAAHDLHRLISPWLQRIGIMEHAGQGHKENDDNADHPSVVLLGFYREASSLLEEMCRRYSESAQHRIMVVDFNPETLQKLRAKGLTARYGDISHPDSLRTLNLHKAEVIICTVPDILLKGTNNLNLLRNLRQLAPDSKIVVTADTIENGRQMYRDNADYVILPRRITAHYLADAIERLQTGASIRKAAAEHLDQWSEVLP